MPFAEPLPQGYSNVLSMCGIIGSIQSHNVVPFLMTGLRRESYRGYDSSGLVVLNDKPQIIKAVGKLEKLEEKISIQEPSGPIGIGHNRWATHGQVNLKNTHPHIDNSGEFFIVHNGIIENFAELKHKLAKKGYTFTSDTDSEIIAHLIAHFYSDNLEEAVSQALGLTKGTYGLIAMTVHEPEKLVAARMSSPVVIAVTKSKSYIASDAAALTGYTDKIVFLDDHEIATVRPGSYQVTDLNNKIKHKKITDFTWQEADTEKGNYPHFMLKEIHEQPQSLKNTMRGRLLPKSKTIKLGGLTAIDSRLEHIERLSIIACGTAYYAGMVGQYMLEEFAGIPTEIAIASEFRYRHPVVTPNTASIFISQSGETADTLAALEMVNDRDELSIGIINTVGSTIARTVDVGLYNHAGPEIGVASTKAFTSQLTMLALLTVYLGQKRQLDQKTALQIITHLARLPDQIEHIITTQTKTIQKIASQIKDAGDVLFIGRKYNYPIALEGALKLKEVSYVHAEGYSAGELKHGAIALIDPSVPTIAIAPQDSVYDKTVSNMQEVNSRSGPIFAIATDKDKDIPLLASSTIFIPKTLEMLTPILSVIPLQLLAYYVGLERGLDVDKPRNLAKSVTVE